MSHALMNAVNRIFAILLSICVMVIWVVVAGRVVPTRLGDRGIFVSVAEHLLRGETLYLTTYDNKEPYFFYFVALQRALGNWAEFLAEIGMVGICSISAYLLARRISSVQSSFIVGFLLVPIIVTGAFYNAALTNLPGTTVVLAMCASLVSGYAALAGGLLALVFLLKIPAIPVALAAAGGLLLFRPRRDLLPFTAAGILVLLVLVGFMMWRGEFWPFVETTKINIRYAQGDLVENAGIFRSMALHIARVWGRDFYTTVAAILLAFALGVIALSPLREADFEARGILVACIAALGATFFALALTGLWVHHNQLLYSPAVLAAVILSKYLDMASERARLSVLVVSLCMAYMLGGAFPLRAHLTSIAEMRKNLAELEAVPPETARLLAVAPSGNYARIGRYDDRGHAIGLENWKLLCPRFHQGQHEPAAILQRSLDCAAKAPVLLIGNDFMVTEEHAIWPQWRSFVDRVEKMLAADYACDAPSGLRVCIRRQ